MMDAREYMIDQCRKVAAGMPATVGAMHRGDFHELPDVAGRFGVMVEYRGEAERDRVFLSVSTSTVSVDLAGGDKGRLDALVLGVEAKAGGEVRLLCRQLKGEAGSDD